jgi:primase-polymerase (primpol)-like protein
MRVSVDPAPTAGGHADRASNLSAIPAELTALPQWVCWHYEQRDGQPTKPPINPRSNGKLLYARSNDPTTWTDFSTAVATVDRLNLEGQGLCLSATDNLTGLDLDHVFDPVTGALDPQATEVLTSFAGTYAEISPSGTGIRIWCYGKPQRSGKCTGKVKWLEVYSYPSNRYLTVTGNHWSGSASAVTEQQDALNWLHNRFMSKGKDDSTGKGTRGASAAVDASLDLDDAALLDKARKARNGALLDALWAGDTSIHGNDHSSADLALLNILAFWTNRDTERMDRLFRGGPGK